MSRLRAFRATALVHDPRSQRVVLRRTRFSALQVLVVGGALAGVCLWVIAWLLAPVAGSALQALTHQGALHVEHPLKLLLGVAIAGYGLLLVVHGVRVSLTERVVFRLDTGRIEWFACGKRTRTLELEAVREFQGSEVEGEEGDHHFLDLAARDGTTHRLATCRNGEEAVALAAELDQLLRATSPRYRARQAAEQLR